MNRSLIMVVIIGIVVAIILLTSPKDAQPTTHSGPTQGPTSPKTTRDGNVLLPLKLVIECEASTTLVDKDPKSGELTVVARTQNEGSPISFLEIPEGWIKRCDMEKLKESPGKLPGQATYDFEVTRDDTYYLNLRAKWADDCGDSVYVKIDEGTWFPIEDSNGKLEGDKNYKWAWHPLTLIGKPKEFDLNKGKHTLYFCTREDGPWLDQWLLTTDASMPVGGPVKKTKP
jgi:hypothetical protein